MYTTLYLSLPQTNDYETITIFYSELLCEKLVTFLENKTMGLGTDSLLHSDEIEAENM